jgi:hypothetical protein
MVKIDISSLSTEHFDHDRTWETMWKAEAFFNSEDFRENYLNSLAFHESGHAAVAILMGVTAFRFEPPSVCWDNERNAPTIRWAQVNLSTSSAPTELVPRLKIWFAGMAAQRKLAPNPAFDALKSPTLLETALAKSDYLNHGGEEKNFEVDKATAESELSELLEIPGFCEGIEMLADDFKSQIFPLPEVPSCQS